MLKDAEEFGKNGIYRFWIGHKPFVVIFEPNKVEKLLSSSKLITKSSDYKYLEPWLGLGLLLSTGQKWHQRRKLLTPAFHFRILKSFMTAFNYQSEILIEKMKAYAESGKPFDIFHDIGLCALDIICETAMGKDVQAQMDGNSPYVQSVSNVCQTIHLRQKVPILWPNILFNFSPYSAKFRESLKILHEFTLKVIDERKIELEETFGDLENVALEKLSEGGKKKLAFLDLLLCTKELKKDDIREEVDTFMFEGHDTTAAAMTWASYLLSTHPTIQKKVHEELDKIFGQSSREATSEDLAEMKYLECVIKEALRLYPSVPYYARRLTEDVTFDDYTVPKDVTVVVFSSKCHLDEKQFPEPKKFNPERFLPENCVKRHPYAFVPFSAGPRNCIGQKFAINEEKVVLSSILRRFKLDPVDKHIEPSAELILRPEDGLMVTAKFRH